MKYGPPKEFIDFLYSLKSRFGLNRLILLIYRFFNIRLTLNFATSYNGTLPVEFFVDRVDLCDECFDSTQIIYLTLMSCIGNNKIRFVLYCGEVKVYEDKNEGEKVIKNLCLVFIPHLGFYRIQANS
jgi:hypothetical protein